MSHQPKPAATGAEAHRQDDGDDEDDDRSVPTGARAGGDRDGGGGGGGQPPSSSSPGIFARVPAKKLAIAGGAAIALYLLWKLYQETDALDIGRGGSEGPERNGSDPEVDPMVREARKRGLRVTDDGQPDIPQRDDDPLAADHEAGKWIFNWGDN